MLSCGSCTLTWTCPGGLRIVAPEIWGNASWCDNVANHAAARLPPESCEAHGEAMCKERLAQSGPTQTHVGTLQKHGASATSADQYISDVALGTSPTDVIVQKTQKLTRGNAIGRSKRSQARAGARGR